METQFEQHLITAGLSKDEARAYETLIKKGSLPASSLGRLISVSSRPLMYKVLDGLITKGLVEKKEKPGSVALFYPTHPIKLKDWTERERERVEQSTSVLEGVVDKLISEFNLSSGKPGVRYFEGRSGVRAVLNDSLTSKSPIYSYTDVEQVETHYKDVVDPYVAERERKGILKKLLLDDTPFVRNFYADSKENQSEVRLIEKSETPHKVAIQIYDDKVSFLTLEPDKEMAVIIQDKEIASLQRHLFDQLYKKAKPLYTPSNSSTSI